MGTKFKPIISIDNGFSYTYRTIITQTTISKRLTEGGFDKKILWSGGYIAVFYRWNIRALIKVAIIS
jgi:hypothetical protein